MGPVPSHTASRRRGGRLPRVGPLGQAPLCSPSRKPLCSAAWAAGEEEQVWLRDRQALEAGPGPAPENNLLGPPGQSEGGGHQGGDLLPGEGGLGGGHRQPRGSKGAAGQFTVPLTSNTRLPRARVGTWGGQRGQRAPLVRGGDLQRLPACSSALGNRDLGGQLGVGGPAGGLQQVEALGLGSPWGLIGAHGVPHSRHGWLGAGSQL